MVGRTISHYKILAKLGEGGMGVVYKAEDVRLKRLVALKFPPLGPVGEQGKKRFLREAQAAASLQHPNICPIYDFGEDEDRIFIAMAFLEGTTLAKRIAEGPISPFEAVAVAAQVADGLGAAHRQGVVHRDVSPSNVMLNNSGHASILDFGLALVRGVTRLTRGESTAGTPAYMSPEQAQGQEVDARTDIWSTGAVLFEMLTGTLPFPGEYEAVMLYSVVNEPVPRLRSLQPDLPAEFQDILDKALAKEPSERYGSASRLADDLRAIQHKLEPSRFSTVGLSQAFPTDDDGSAGEAYVTVPRKRPAVRRKRALPTKSRLFWASAVAGFVGLLLSAWALLLRDGSGFRAAMPKEKHVAVLPFEIPADDAELQALSDGLIEVLTAKLTQLEQFRGSMLVVPASEIRSRDINSVEDAYRNYGANLVVTGSARRWAEIIQVTANLVDATQIRQLSAVSFDVSIEDMASLRDGAIMRVVNMLEVQLTPAERTVVLAEETNQPSAYVAYLKGRGYLRRFDVEGNIDRAISSLETAVQSDPAYSLAYAALGEALWRKARITNDQRWSDQALKHAERAVMIAPGMAIPHAKLGSIYAQMGRADEAIAEFNRSLAAQPGYAEAHRGLGRAYSAAGRFEEAELAYRKAVDLRPNDWYSHNLLGVFYFGQGRYDEAEDAFRQARNLTPDNDYPYRNLGIVHLRLGHLEEAKAQLMRSVEIEPSFLGFENLGIIFSLEGRRAEAIEAYETAIDLQPNNPVGWAGLADIYSFMPGEDAKADAAYARAIELAKKRLEVIPGDLGVIIELAGYFSKSGDSASAKEILTSIRDVAGADLDSRYKLALAYELTGQRTRAIKELREVLDAGFSLYVIRTDPFLSSLRSDASFTSIAREPQSTIER